MKPKFEITYRPEVRAICGTDDTATVEGIDTLIAKIFELGDRVYRVEECLPVDLLYQPVENEDEYDYRILYEVVGCNGIDACCRNFTGLKNGQQAARNLTRI